MTYYDDTTYVEFCTLCFVGLFDFWQLQHQNFLSPTANDRS